MQISSTPLPQPLWERKTNWLRYPEIVGLPKEDGPVPDFLTICPSRTGTTWLARHLGRHPGIWIPAEKELRYFDVRWRMQGIDWYQRQFQPAGPRLKGESTPSYALLPEIAIRTIQAMNPRLKLIFLARRLPERAWSHTRHGCRHYEGIFRDRTALLGELPTADLARDFLSDYALSSADYCGTLRRWLGYFPREQFHVRYFEDAISQPEAYFGGLLRFLGVDEPLPPDDLHARVNPGGETAFPGWAGPFLDNLFASRQNEIEIFLESTFGLHPNWLPARRTPHDPIWLEDHEAGWRVSLHDGLFEGVRFSDGARIDYRFLHDLRQQMKCSGPAVALPVGPAIEESRLEAVLHELAEEFAAAQVVHVGALQGFNIVRWKKLFFGIRQAIGAIDITEETEELRTRWSTKDLVIAPLRSEVEAQIRTLEADRSDSTGRFAPPRLLGGYKGFNLVDYAGAVYGLRQCLGPIDLTQCSTLAHQFAAADFVVDNSEAAVTRRIDEIEDGCEIQGPHG